MKIAILGYGSQGASALSYFQAQGGHEITICDNNEALEAPAVASLILGADYLSGLEDFDLLVRSPSVHPRDIADANGGEAILDKVTTNTNIFMEVCPTRKIIGVTGTKGKGTTSSLIAKMLEAAGYKVHLGGNIGIPPLEMLQDGISPDDWVVLELANFQLIDIRYSPPVAVCLMVTGEHLDWHPTVDEYIQAKQQLFRWQQPDDTTVYFKGNELSEQVVSLTNGHKIPYFSQPGAFINNGKVVIGSTSICDVNEIKLLGQHNWQNVCAAVTAAWHITQDSEALRRTVQAFSGLPYRLELVRERGGVKYYNDSFGSTPETAIVAIRAFEEPKIVILGGSDKGADFHELADTVAEGHVKHIVAIGVTGPRIADEIKKSAPDVPLTLLEGKPSMQEIVGTANQYAEAGDIVLLSTGCASFGMFTNYKDRGDQFNQVVRALP